MFYVFVVLFTMLLLAAQAVDSNQHKHVVFCGNRALSGLLCRSGFGANLFSYLLNVGYVALSVHLDAQT